MKVFLILALFIFNTGSVFSQNFADKEYYLIDSLIIDNLTDIDKLGLEQSLALYHKSLEDTTKINALLHLCEEVKDEMWIRYNDHLLEYVEKKIEEENSPSIHHHLKKSLATILSNKGFYYDLKGDGYKALEYYKNSLNIRKELGDKKAIAYSVIDIGYIYEVQGNISKALECFFYSLKILENLNDEKGIGAALSNIGLVYYYQRDFSLALKFHEKSLSYKEKLNDKIGIATSFSNIGLIYFSQNDSSQALNYYRKSLVLLEELGYQHGTASVLYNIGEVYKNQAYMITDPNLISEKTALINNALIYYYQVLEIRKNIKDKRGLSYCMIQIANIHLERGDLKKSKKYAISSLKISQEIGYPRIIERAAELLSKIHEKENNDSESLDMYKLFITMRDSTENQENKENTIKQNIKYEFEKKEALTVFEHEKELALNALENQQQEFIIWSISIGMMLVLIFTFIIANRLKVSNTQKQLIEEKNNENKLLLGEIHHRVKNNLQVISSLLSLQEKSISDESAKRAISEGKERVKSMGLIHKMLYQNDNFSGIEMKDYIVKLLDGLMDSFGVNQSSMEVDTNFDNVKLDVDSAIPIGLIINELVINAFKYAYDNIDAPKITVKLEKQPEGLVLCIKDNGIGTPAKVKESNSFGFKLVKSLVRQLDGELTLISQNGLSYSILIKDYKLV